MMPIIPLVAALPLFEALMLGVEIAGVATVTGSSTNLVAAKGGPPAGIAAWLLRAWLYAPVSGLPV